MRNLYWLITFLVSFPVFGANESPRGLEVIERILTRLEIMRESEPALGDFTRRLHFRGPNFILYEHDVSDVPNPKYKEQEQAFEGTLKKIPKSKPQMGLEIPKPYLPVFGKEGIRMMVRFDFKGQSPIKVPSDHQFGDLELSILDISGPDNPKFSELRKKLMVTIDQEISSYKSK